MLDYGHMSSDMTVEETKSYTCQLGIKNCFQYITSHFKNCQYLYHGSVMIVNSNFNAECFFNILHVNLRHNQKS